MSRITSGWLARHTPQGPGGRQAALIDIAQDLLLARLYQRGVFDHLVFKGGTALRKLYAGNAGRIVAVDVKDGSLEKARRLGATDIVNSGYTDPVQAVRDLLPSGADHAFDFVGLTQVTAQALEMLTVGGGLYLIGVARPDTQVALSLATAVLRQPRIVGVTPARPTPGTTSRCSASSTSTAGSH